MKVLYATDAFPASLDAGIALERWLDPMKVRVTVLSVTHSGSLIPAHLVPELDPKPVRRDQSVEIAMTATAPAARRLFLFTLIGVCPSCA